MGVEHQQHHGQAGGQDQEEADEGGA